MSKFRILQTEMFNCLRLDDYAATKHSS